MSAKPTIILTRSLNKGRFTSFCIKLGLKCAGAKVVVATSKNPHDDLECHGLVIAGGTDIHPSYYQCPPNQDYLYEVDRDQMELAWLKKAQNANLPVLGICRGAQLMNIARGGSLYPQVHKAFEEAQYPSSLMAKIFYRKRMFLNTSSMIYGITHCSSLKVNSMHKQAINALGQGLKVAAKERNDVVQVIEDPSRKFFMGVQFHPEFLLYSKYHRNIFNTFVSAAKSALKIT